MIARAVMYTSIATELWLTGELPTQARLVVAGCIVAVWVSAFWIGLREGLGT